MFEQPSFDPEASVLGPQRYDPDSLFDAQTLGRSIDEEPASPSLMAEAQYNRSIRDLPQLTPEAEKLLVEQIQSHGETAEIAKWELVTNYLPFAAWVARRSMGLNPTPEDELEPGESPFRGARIGDLSKFKGSPLPLADRIQEATIGLIKAAEKYKMEGGARFSTYSMWWVESAIQKAIQWDSENSGPRVPGAVQTELFSVIRERGLLEQDLNRTVLPKDIATQLDIEQGRVKDLLKLAELKKFQYLEDIQQSFNQEEDTVGDEDHDDRDEPLSWSDRVYDPHMDPMEKEAFLDVLADDIEKVLKDLPEREATVIRMRFGLDGMGPKTFEEVGNLLGVTRERIRQIEVKTLSKLRHPRYSTRWRDYLDDHNVAASSYYHQPAVEPGMPWPRKARKAETVAIPEYLPTDHVTAQFQAFRSELLVPSYAAPTIDTAKLTTIENQISERLGDNLTVDALSDFWNKNLAHYLSYEDLNADNFTVLFSHLLGSKIQDGQEVRLRIPSPHYGKLNRLGSGLERGYLSILGEAGDRVGEFIKGSAKITVVGNAGDYAGTGIRDEGELTILGNAGDDLGTDGRGGIIEVRGDVGKHLGREVFGPTRFHIKGSVEGVDLPSDSSARLYVAGQRIR